MSQSQLKSHYRTCTLCEAMCGIKIELDGEKILSIKGDKEDSFSQGHICPKAIGLQDLYNDKDRLTMPVKKVEGEWVEISWKAAFKEVAKNLKSIQSKHGKNAVGVYLGNPTVHNVEAMINGPAFFNLLKTRNRYAATSVDQLPHHLAAMLMFGHPLLIPIPDIDHTDYMVILGANPVVSNGSIMTAPNVKKRLKAIQKRGGQFITIDPRFTETSAIADQHLFIKPGTDAYLVMAMINILFEKGLVESKKLASHIEGVETVQTLVKDYTAESVAEKTGISSENIEKLVEEFCQADSALLYARIGVSTHEFGSLVNWLTCVFNILTGNMDSQGGMMFPNPAIDLVGFKKPKVKKFGRFHSRISQYPETIGELPVVALAEEILTEGKDQIKAMVVAAGNPLLSTPNNKLLTKAFKTLDFMLSVDFYINETSRHANVILPPPTPLERPHYDLIFNHLAVRNHAKYSEALFDKKAGSLSESEIYWGLTQAMAPKGLKAQSKTWMRLQVMKWLGTKGVINKGLKAGPYGKQKNSLVKNLDIKQLMKHDHGLDLGELTPCFPEKILTKNGKINLAPKEFVDDLVRLEKHLSNKPNPQSMLLIGRRDARTCNSWMHNSYRLVKGKERCVAHINQLDAENLKIVNGQLIKVNSRVGEIKIPVEITETIMPGVISIPHGWGHGQEGTKMSIANAHSGVSINELTDEKFVDELTGNAALNGVPVEVASI